MEHESGQAGQIIVDEQSDQLVDQNLQGSSPRISKKKPRRSRPAFMDPNDPDCNEIYAG